MTSQDKFIAWAEKNMPTLHLDRSEVSGHFVSPVTGNIFIGWSARDGEVEALRTSLLDCADSLHAEMLSKFAGQSPDDMHPVTRRQYDRDMSELAGYLAVLSKEAQS